MRHPRRASKQRLEGAPPYVVAIYDSGPKFNDRYTVFFGWPIWQPEMGRSVPYLGFNECPTSPNMGVSMWGEGYYPGGRGPGKPIAWSDLPPHLQQHVFLRANYPEKVKVARLVKVGNEERIVLKPNGVDKRGIPKNRTITRRLPIWGFEPTDGIGYFGPTFETKAEARQYASAHNIILLSP